MEKVPCVNFNFLPTSPVKWQRFNEKNKNHWNNTGKRLYVRVPHLGLYLRNTYAFSIFTKGKNIT